VTWEKFKAYLRHYWYAPLLFLVLFVLILLSSFGPDSKLINGWLDALAKRNDRATRRAERQIEARTEAKIQDLEKEHEATLNTLQENQVREYDAVRAQGPIAVQNWLRDFDRQQREKQP